jgi:alpha-L-fucosidase 2
VNYTREYFCSYPGRVLAMRITADRPGAVNCTVGMDLYHRERNPGTIVDSKAGTVDVFGNIDDNNRPYVIRIRLINEDGELVHSGSRLTARRCNAVTLYYTVATDYVLKAPLYRGADPAAITADCIGKAVKSGYRQLLGAHTVDYRGLYSRTRLSLGNSGEKAEMLPTDERLNRFIKNSDYSDLGLKELAFNFGKYILISCSRPGALPAGLYGVWNDRYRARWNGVYQLDMNTTQTYMFGNALNLSECQVPFIEWTMDKTISGNALARDYFGSSGWFSGMIGDIWGNAGMLGDNGYKFNSTGWLALIAWEQYAFDRDREYLMEIYPLLKGASRFYLDNLVEYKNSGKLVTFAFPSAEHVSPAGALMPNFQDIGFAAETFENTAEAAATLGIDEEFRNRILETKTRLMPYKTGSWGQFQEWVEDLDDPLCQHRHISQVLPLTPCHQINLLENPEFMEPLKVTMNARGDAGFLALRHPEKGNSDLFPTKCTHEGYHFDNFTAQVWCRAARICDWLRLYDGSRADKIYNDILRESTLENMMQYETMLHYSVADSAATPCFPDGTVLSAGYVTEMVLQSHLGELHLLPALPPAWETGSLTGIRARGGYTLDIHWKEAKLVKAIITADQTGTCRIRYGGKTRVLDLTGGNPLTVTDI